MTRQVAIVSGGAGGIGSTISSRLAEAGYSVVVADASEEGAQAAVQGLSRARDQRHVAVTGDLTRDETNRRVVDCGQEIGVLSSIVNAVGISPKKNGEKIDFFDIDSELWDSILAVNLKAPFLLVREAYASMPTDGSASIVNLLSITAKLGAGGLATDGFPPFLPSTAAYAASKAALQNLTATLARELSSYGIRVNGVAPGLIATEMTGAVPDKGGMAAQIPMRRFGTPQEVADAIEFLLSEKSSYITGASLDLNGGWHTC